MRVDEKIKEWKIENPERPFFSLEFFPPKTETGVLNLYNRFDRFASLHPLWIDVTWGAGGSTSEKTMNVCLHALEVHGLEPLMHLTCTNMSEELLQQTLENCYQKGIRNILTLRGDPPAGENNWSSAEGQFKHAIDLMKYIKEKYDDYFCIAVAGYPEGHFENPDIEDDLKRLKEKVDEGASLIITQLFFDVQRFKEFVQNCRAIGITVPILPGIMPIQSYSGFKRFTAFSRTSVPQDITDRLEIIKDDDKAVKEFGIDLGIKMCKELLCLGAPGLHFYTLNQEASVSRIIRGLEIEGCCVDKTKHEYL